MEVPQVIGVGLQTCYVLPSSSQIVNCSTSGMLIMLQIKRAMNVRWRVWKMKGGVQTKQLTKYQQQIATFRIILQKEVEVTELAEDFGLHFAIGLKDERIVAANSLWEKITQVKKNFLNFFCLRCAQKQNGTTHHNFLLLERFKRVVLFWTSLFLPARFNGLKYYGNHSSDHHSVYNQKHFFLTSASDDSRSDGLCCVCSIVTEFPSVFR